MTSPPTGQIVAMGGGGFSMEGLPLLDDFVLSLARQTPARVCFLPTASGDSLAYVTKFYRTFSGRCIPSDLTLVDSPGLPRRPSSTGELEAFVAQQDVFYVGGGNTLNLLALWRAHGIDRLLRAAWCSGAILSGISAGMNCWFEACLTDSFGALEPLHDGLGLLAGSACPHYDGEAQRRPKLHEALLNGLPPAYAAEDGVALHFVGRDLVEAVSSRPNARAYRVEVRDGQVVEEPIPTRFLGAGGKRPVGAAPP
jgi:dipeptidase E